MDSPSEIFRRTDGDGRAVRLGGSRCPRADFWAPGRGLDPRRGRRMAQEVEHFTSKKRCFGAPEAHGKMGEK